MKNGKFMAGDAVYVAARKGRDVAEYTFCAYSSDYPNYARVSFMANGKDHTMLLSLAVLHKTRAMAASAKRLEPERKRKAYVAPKLWIARKIDYKRLVDDKYPLA